MRLFRLQSKNTGATATPDLDNKYYIWSFLMVLKVLQLCFANYTQKLDYLLAGVFIYFVITNLKDLKEQIFLFLMAYLTDFSDWFVSFKLIGESGSRILLVDIFFLWIFINTFSIYLRRKKSRKFYLSRILIGLTLFWMLNFVLGLASGGGGHAIGEARFYFVSIFVLFFVIEFHDDFNLHLRKFFKIVTLASFNVGFCVLILLVTGKSLETGISVDEITRYNPGNDLAMVLVFGLLLAIIDFLNRTDYHLYKGRKDLIIGLYLIVLFLAGVRTMLLVTGLIMVYYFLLSPKLALGKKILAGLMLVIGGMVFLQFQAAQTLVETQSKYVSLVDGSRTGKADNTASWRFSMWEIFYKRLSEDKVRYVIGRPFGDDQINISELNWYWRKKKVTHVDNSMAHNDFLSIAMTNGMVFAFIFLMVNGLYVLKAFRSGLRYKQFKHENNLLGWMLFTQTIMSFLNASIKHYGFSIMLWIFLAFLATQFNNNQILLTEEDEIKNGEEPQNINRNSVLQSRRVH